MFLYFFSISVSVDSCTDSRMRYHSLTHSWATLRCAQYNSSLFTLSFFFSGVPRGGLGCSNPPRNSEGPPKSCQTQPDCENF